ncbi:MAG: radical SAM family heme chaperone HemW [Firmicutes bacterium]|nr:radical SAM family heme chaperone HemW [Bacillota bacterium]
MGLAVYVHIPFCVRKCNYCDFPSYPVAGMDVDGYLAAMGREMSWYKGDIAGTEVSTLYVGGGTPSILANGQLEFLFEAIRHNFTFEADAEISLEANPGTLDFSKLNLLKELGVNRLSLGVQGLDPGLLKRLGRIHTPGQALEAFDLARRAGFTNINLDLMHGLPGMTEEGWRQTLQQAVALGPEHISVYGLIIEEETPFGLEYEAGSLELPDEEERARMFAWSGEFLTESGYNHYEISNYALPGRECRHNQVYWRNEKYLGFGAGAASYRHRVRRTNYRQVGQYMAVVSQGRLPLEEKEETAPAQEISETMFLGLRLTAGVQRSWFLQRFGIELDQVYGDRVAALVSKGLLLDDGDSVRLSSSGILLANEVFCEFLP